MTGTTQSEPLLVRIARGDPDAVEACLQRYGPLVWTVAKRSGCDLATIEDVVQEVFITVWKNAGRYDPSKAGEATFIATIARRRVIDRRRRAGRAPVEEPVEEQEIGRGEPGFAEVDLGEEVSLARSVLAELKDDQRRAILMSVVDGMSHQDIATRTGMPLGTVKSHIRRGLDQAAQKIRSMRGGSP